MNGRSRRSRDFVSTQNCFYCKIQFKASGLNAMLKQILKLTSPSPASKSVKMICSAMCHISKIAARIQLAIAGRHSGANLNGYNNNSNRFVILLAPTASGPCCFTKGHVYSVEVLFRNHYQKTSQKLELLEETRKTLISEPRKLQSL